MNTSGYHGTSENFRYSIEKDGLDPEKSKYRSDHWLGQGVYFFADYNIAMWWANTISSQNENCGALIYKSEICAPDCEVLDLDNNSHVDKFYTELLSNLEEIKECCKEKMPVFTFENCRAVFFDYYKIKNNISVVIETFQKDYAKYTAHRTKEEMNAQCQLMKAFNVRYSEKQICVSKKECITLTKLVYNEQEEVI